VSGRAVRCQKFKYVYMNYRNYMLSALLCGCIHFACEQPKTRQSKDTSPPQTTYLEKHRLQFHFSPKAKWMNDPNGMVFYEGEYHLFYQYFPDSTRWGPMHWGHAVSTDMVRWEHLPIALYPDSLGYIFSGSAVVDWDNTSGFGQNGKPPLVAIYTYHEPKGEKAGRKDYQYQGIAYSNDKGRTWTKYAQNPVIPNPGNTRDFRDPKVIWHPESSQWIMALAVQDHAEFWGSRDLKIWSKLSEWGREYGGHGGVWECPDLIPITAEGTGEKKWVLLQSLSPGGLQDGSGTQYFVGDFDGKQFTLDEDFKQYVPRGKGVWFDSGRDNYAGVTWSGVPEKDGRTLWLGWMSNWLYAQDVPTLEWRSAMTLPRALTLKKTEYGYRLVAQPVAELASLRGKSHRMSANTIEGSLDLTPALGFSPTQSEFILELELPAEGAVNCGIELSNNKGEKYRIGFDAGRNQFYSDRRQSGDFSFSNKFAGIVYSEPRLSGSKTLKLHVFIDAASIELFADDGAMCMTEIFFPSEDFSNIKLFAENGNVALRKGEWFALRSIWP
jgi:fructan beta-fructosidase